MWETSISVVRKMLSVKECKYAQWFSVQGREVIVGHEYRVSTPGTKEKPMREYIASYASLTAIDQLISSKWMTYPRILAFDIETYSDNHKALPNKTNAKHDAYMISCIYQEMKRPETRKKVLIVLGYCGDIEDADVLRASTEIEAIQMMTQTIQRFDPEIISGYNIFAYDYPYLDFRLKSSGEDWFMAGRLLNRLPQMQNRTWKSSAYSHNIINDLKMEGRINVDMLPIIRRDYKLDKYSLDFVSHNFLKKGKHDIKATEMFEIYEINLAAKEAFELDPDLPETAEKIQHAQNEMKRVGEYCLEDAILCIDLFDKLNIWIGLVELSSIVGVTIVELFTRGQQIRCLSQIYDLASSLGYVIDKKITAKMFYSGGYVFEPISGLYDNIICLDFASLYPSIMMAYNICYTTLVSGDMNQYVKDEDCNIAHVTQEEPIDMVGVKVKSECDSDSEDEEEEELDDQGNPIPKEEKKTKTVKYVHRFVKREVRDGILPQLVRALVDQRNIVKGQMKGYNARMKLLNKELKTVDVIDELNSLELVLVVLDKRQLALKVSANSMYGFLGVQNGGLLPLIEGAMSVTSWGRSLIGQVNKYIETKYGGTIVYGDTDSSMADLHIKDPVEASKMGYQLMREISGVDEKRDDDGNIIAAAIPGLFPPPLKVEFEKLMRLLCIKKKKYAYYGINKDGSYVTEKDTGLPKIEKKGIMIARRDNCAYARTCYVELLRHILDRKPMNEAFDIVINACNKLTRFEVPPKGNLAVIRELGSNYKSSNYFMKVFADELFRIGKPANPGDRLEYIVVKTADEDIYQVPLGKKMRALELWEEEEIKEDVDCVYYIEHLLMNPLDQLFGVGYKTQLSKCEVIGFTPQNSNCHFVGVKTPIKMVSALIKDKLEEYSIYAGSQKDKLALISPAISDLKVWFSNEYRRVTTPRSRFNVKRD
jgi:DNA polymerase elongation subunit (family B)